MTQRISFSSIVLALSVAVIIGPAVPPAAADEPPTWLCEETRATRHPLPALVDPGDVVWDILYEIGIGPERVAVVVWHDPVGDPPDGLYYGPLQSSIDTYAADVAAAGFTVAVIKFYGMAEDPDHPDAGDLRRRLRQMWEEEKSLAGAVLVGNVPHLLYETISTADFPCDRLLCDMDGEIYDYETSGGFRAGVFDTWEDENQEIEIWTSRIMARPELVGYEWGESYTQVDILTTYFARNHSDRWNAFNSSGEALLYSVDGIWWEWVDVLVVLAQLFGDLTAVCPDPELCPDGVPSWGDYVEVKLPHGYAHIQITSHGPPTATEHYLDRAAVTREHYRDIDPDTMSWVFETCYAFDFANPDAGYWDGACLGEVVVFNPEAPTLVGFGCTRTMACTNFIPYYSPLTEGRCLGEGYKDVVNATDNPPAKAAGFVLLGDGTLKRWGETAIWTGEGPLDEWDWPENWSIDVVPMDTDNVVHDNEDVIQMNTGTHSLPNQIMGFEGDGVLGGGLLILPDRDLLLSGDAVFANDYEVTLLTAVQPTPTQLTVEGGIFGGNFTLNDRCDVEVGTGPGAPRSELYGTWALDGADAHAWFKRAEAITETPLLLTLDNGAHVEIEEMRYDCPPDCGTFPDAAEHELVYGPGTNGFGGGREACYDTDRMYFGDYTRIRALDEGEENVLNLDLRSELHIASVFEHTSVCQAWDTRGVDITAQPIWAVEPHPGQDFPEQAIELISPEFGESFQGDPLAFIDVPCHGAFRDLIIAPWEPDEEHPADDPPLPVVMRDYYDNAASGWEPEATAFFRNVIIGANREVRFYSTHGLIYYWGILEMEDGANVYVDDVPYDVCGPACRGVVDTIYGDWNGDCMITNVELAELQSAIRGGPGAYDPLMDYDCDGVLTNLVELPAFLDNMRTQPSCERRRGFGGGGAGAGPDGGAGAESCPEWYEGYEDVPGLAAWLIEVLSEEQLDAFVADLEAATAEFAGTPVGQDLAELLFWLQETC